MEVAVIILRRSSGEYFVHQRAAGRKIFPGLFGLGAGGKLDPGETPVAAAARELREETGIIAEPRALFPIHFHDGSQDIHIHVFEVCTAAEIRPDPREWQWSGWLTPPEVDRLAADGKLCPDTAIFFARYRSECEQEQRV